jgi:hypothetical protein
VFKYFFPKSKSKLEIGNWKLEIEIGNRKSEIIIENWKLKNKTQNKNEEKNISRNYTYSKKYSSRKTELLITTFNYTVLLKSLLLCRLKKTLITNKKMNSSRKYLWIFRHEWPVHLLGRQLAFSSKARCLRVSKTELRSQ